MVGGCPGQFQRESREQVVNVSRELMGSDEVEIRYVKKGVANRFDTHIEMHEDLKQFPDLHNRILEHELKHSDKGVTKQDIVMDIYSGQSLEHTVQLLKFMIKRPSTWKQFSPLYKAEDGKFYWDMSLLVFYLIFGSFTVLVLMILLWVI